MTGAAIKTEPRRDESAEITVDEVASKARTLNDRLSTAMPAQLRKVNAHLERANRILEPSTEDQSTNASAETSKVAPHKMCKLDVQKAALSREVTFTIPEGMSGKMVLDAIEKANPREQGYGVVWPQSSLLNDAGIETIVAQDTKFSTTIWFDLNSLTRGEQASYLKYKGLDLDFTDRWILTVASALYRDEYGFPSDRNDIGTLRDKGDLFKGQVIRRKQNIIKTRRLR